MQVVHVGVVPQIWPVEEIPSDYKKHDNGGDESLFVNLNLATHTDTNTEQADTQTDTSRHKQTDTQAKPRETENQEPSERSTG